MDAFRDLYQQLIIDHNKNPNNYYELKNANHVAEGHNPLCGDEIIIYIVINNDSIDDIAFTGSGCAISKASASIMTNELKGLKIKEANELFNKFHLLATEVNHLDSLGKLCVLAGVHKYPSRVKCATLAWHTFQGAINNSNEIIKTE